MESPKLKPLPETGLYRLKWEYEKEKTSFNDLLGFGTADMDYASPEPILNTLNQIISTGHLGYTMTPDAFYEAIQNWLYKHTGWMIDAQTSVSQNTGIYTSVSSILDLLTVPGDRIAILTPVHFCFKRKIILNNRQAIECPLVENDGIYQIDYSALDSCLSCGCKLLWMCNPHNPVGRAWTQDELQKIADLCLKHNVYILSDDVYCGLTFPGITYTPIASLSKEISYRTVTCYSASKCYNTAGLRHSYLVIENPELKKRYDEDMERLDLIYGRNIMGIAATIAAYNKCDDWLTLLMTQIEKNHNYLSSYVRDNLPGCRVIKSESTYFAWIDMRQLHINPQKLSYLLEQEEHILVENGFQLGKGGAGFIRFNLATSEDNIRAGAERLQTFWHHYLQQLQQ